MLMTGTTISKLNHLECPALEKINQNGRMTKTTITNPIINPKGPIYIGISLIEYRMNFLLKNSLFSYLLNHLGLVIGIRNSGYRMPVHQKSVKSSPGLGLVQNSESSRNANTCPDWINFERESTIYHSIHLPLY